jgi:hypothetical protein
VEIADAVRGRGMRAPMSMWQQHLVRIGMVVVATLAITAALVIQRPHSEPPAQTQPPATARDLLAKAIAQYGVPLKGEGIIHQHVEINTGQPDVTVIADAWTDGANPARHRMQITVNNALQEWQAGDGQGSLRYVSSGILQSCGRNYPDSRVPVGQINRWSMSDADQAAMRRARWQFGPWATGRRYLEQAQAAEQLRSLGVAVEDGYRVLTIAAEGPTINGTLLLKLDVDNLTLHEVREVLIDQGATSTRVPWKVGSIEHLDKVDATSSGVLDNYPAQPRPQEYDRPMPILDPACPLWDTDHAHSLTSTISQGITPVVGLTQVPPEIERIYLAGRRRAGGSTNGEDDYLRLIYVGGGKRLTLLALPDLAARPARVATPSEWVAAGPWLVRIHSAGLGTVRGDALPAGSQPDPSAFWFVAEGWTEPEVLALLSGAHRLDLRDVTAQRSLIYDPGMTPATAGASIDGS